MAHELYYPSYTYLRDPNSITGSDHKFCIEVGQHHVACIITKRQGDDLKHFALFSLKSAIAVGDLKSILESNPLYTQLFDDVVVVVNQKEMVLIPTAYQKDHLDQVLLETIHGDLEELQVFKDDVHQWELSNIYGFNKSFIDLLKSFYPHCRFVHYASATLRAIFRQMNPDATQWAKVFFSPSVFTVVVMKSDQLHLIQQFYYETREDVIYHLLNVADKFNLDLASIVVEVSGTIDSESGIWLEMKKYFLEIMLEDCKTADAVLHGQFSAPLHYYTPSLLIPKCV